MLDIKRDGEVIATVAIDEKTVLTHKLMGEHKIVADVIVNQVLPIQLGDYIEHNTEFYRINTTPGVEKVNNFTYRYVIAFEGEVYSLYNKLFMDEGAADFSYHGSPEEFLLLLLTNINSIDAGWSIAEVAPAEDITLSFSGDSCRTALTKIAEAFDMEYRLSGRAIYLLPNVGAPTTLQFEYGRGRGLYSLSRNSIDDKALVTRLFAFGARKNIDQDYREGATRLVFEDLFIEQNIDLYGVREGSVIFDDVFPNRTGTVTAIDPNDIYSITDSSLNFDINDFLIEGNVAKIVFKTGALAGYEFEINRYRPDGKIIDFTLFAEENGYELPNELNHPEVGDEYTLIDITMPQVYIDEAEALLLDRAQQYLDENSVPRVSYDLDIDERYVRQYAIDLRVGFTIRIIDEALGLDNDIRVAEITYPLVNPDKVSALIADTIPYTVQEQLISSTIDNEIYTQSVDLERQELARRSAARFRQLQDLVFDPDGYFDPENIRPSSIETLMLSVGAKSQNFGLLGVTIQANYEGDENALRISNGQLAHYEIEIEALGYVWDMDPEIFTGLNPEVAYYVYAKCATTSLTGVWEVSEEPRRVDDEEGYYLFNLGILYTVSEERRDFAFTNGMTYITGDTITTGRIKSLDGLNYFDLTEGKFFLGNDESSLDYNVTEEGRLTLRGVLVSSMILAEDAVIENLIVRNLRTRETGARVEILQDSNNMVVYDAENRPVAIVDDNLDFLAGFGTLAGFQARDPDRSKSSSMSGRGIYSNGGGTVNQGSITGVIEPNNSASVTFGVGGYNNSDDDNNFGGAFFGGLYVGSRGAGFVLDGAYHSQVRYVSTSQALRHDDYILSCYNQSNIALIMPTNPRRGRTFIIRRNNNSQVILDAPDDFLQDGVVTTINVGGGRGDAGLLVWDGQYWLYQKLIR